MPPIPIEVEVPDGRNSDGKLAAEIAEAIHTRLSFRGQVTLVPQAEFGDSGYKTQLTVRHDG
jgi:hypothetical protein